MIGTVLAQIHILSGKAQTREVKLNGKILTPVRSQMVINHSSDGFMWGYHGSGPAQLALAVLLEIAHSEKAAKKLYQEFKSKVIAKLPTNSNFEIQIDPITFTRII